ncbi:transmembrane protein 272-like [Aquarana catesbeiana]|uniref:transmembrane protein 272-like n=1 Tax=Aquarana catesbeiana TaxID=8400 RepID=UPI003CC947D7
MGSACNIGLQIFSLIIWIGLSIAMIVMGVINKDKCPIQPYIPIFLLVTGATHLAAVALLLVRSIFETCSMILEGLIGTFSFAWFITGSVWVFKVYKEYEGQCDKDLYLFAFGILLLEYVLLGLALICPCLCGSHRAFYERLE